MSVLIVFGKWAIPHFRRSSTAIGICLGFVAITIYFVDLEDIMEKAVDVIKSQEKYIEKADKQLNTLKLKNKGYKICEN